MSSSTSSANALVFPLVECGFENRLLRMRANAGTGHAFHLKRAAVLVLITFVPLLVLSFASNHAMRGAVDIPLLHDPALYGRFLFVLPALELAEIVVAVSLIVQVQQFIDSEIVPAHQRPRFDAAIDEVLRLRASPFAGIAIAVLALGTSLTMRVIVIRSDVSSWERLGSSITLAGWWYALVSLPILLFFLIRWLFIFCLWSWFLFRVSRMDLELTPTHPDRSGGLGFLGWGLASFATVLMALSAVISAGLAYEIIHRNESLNSLKYHVIVFVVLAIVVIHAPLLAFTGRLSRTRFKGLLDYSSLVLRHDRAFDKKWVEEANVERSETLLGSPDIQTLADIATVYEHVDDMWLLPLDLKAFAVLVFAALIPMLPLIATVIPLNEILAKLFELVV